MKLGFLYFFTHQDNFCQLLYVCNCITTTVFESLRVVSQYFKCVQTNYWDVLACYVKYVCTIEYVSVQQLFNLQNYDNEPSLHLVQQGIRMIWELHTLFQSPVLFFFEQFICIKCRIEYLKWRHCSLMKVIATLLVSGNDNSTRRQF